MIVMINWGGNKLTFIKLLKFLRKHLKLFLEIIIVLLLEPFVGYLFRISKKHFIILDVKLIEFSDWILRYLVRIHVDCLKDSDFSLLLNHTFFCFFTAGLLVIRAKINN